MTTKRSDQPLRRVPDSTSQDPWRTESVAVRGQAVIVATRLDLGGGAGAATQLLAQHMQVAPADLVLELGRGVGLAGTVAARLAGVGRVHLADRNVIACEAAARTLALNGIDNASVHLSDGMAGLALTQPADVALVQGPKEKLVALQLVWDAWNALRDGGRLYVAGANDEGIRPLLRHTEALFGALTLLDYRRGNRIGMAVKGALPAALPEAFASSWLDHARWKTFDVLLCDKTFAVWTRPGIFAWDRLDPGTRLLAETMTAGEGHDVLDLGCGAGILGTLAGLRGAASVALVDSDTVAVEAARRTTTAAGLTTASVWPGDAAAPVRERRFDRVVTNPPFHAGKGTEYAAAARFIRDAAALLRPHGHLELVANRHLPYEHLIQEAFGAVRLAGEADGFKVLVGEKTRA